MNINKKSAIMLSMIISSVLLTSTPTLAASEQECAIWLCAPQGFAPSACKGARKALVKRLFRGKSAMPDLSSCMVGGDSNSNNTQMTATQGFVRQTQNGEWEPVKVCPTRYRRLGVCHRSVSVYNNGVQEGETYYFNEFHDDIETLN